MLAQIPGWAAVDGRRLERTFTFETFAQALDFTVRVAASGEEQGHHPRLTTEWGRTTVAWWTHYLGGLHRNDFIMAARTDAIAAAGWGRQAMGRVVHFEIQGDDPAELARFYRQALGWAFQTWEGAEGYWVMNTGPHTEAGIDGGIMGRRFPQAVINTARVDSLAETLEKIAAAGGRTVSGPNGLPGVGRHAYCADPQGNLFGVIEPAADG